MNQRRKAGRIPTSSIYSKKDLEKQIFEFYIYQVYNPFYDHLVEQEQRKQKQAGASGHQYVIKAKQRVLIDPEGKTNAIENHNTRMIVWLMVILRVKTILYEKLEANGFQRTKNMGENEQIERGFLQSGDAHMEQYDKYLKDVMKYRIHDFIRQQMCFYNHNYAQFFEDQEIGIQIVENIITKFKMPYSLGNHWQDIRVTDSYLKVFPEDGDSLACDTQSFVEDICSIMRGGLINKKGMSRRVPRQLHLKEGSSFHQCFVGSLGIFAVQPRRIVLIDASKKVCGFSYTQYIELAVYGWYDSRKESWDKDDSSMFQEYQERYEKEIMRNNNLYECFKPEYVYKHLPPAQRVQTAQKIENCVISCEWDSDPREGIHHYYMPLEFTDQPVDPQIAEGFKKWQPPFGEWVNKMEFHETKDQSQTASSQIVDQVSEEKGSFQLLKMIKSVPKIKFVLTPEQELMISTPQNLLCLGRSGTGKTTSSALRLFATEAFYKYHSLLNDFKEKHPDRPMKEFQVPDDFMYSKSDLRLTFLSASPVLVNEVKRFYVDFKSHLTRELTNSRKKRAEKAQNKEDESIEIINDTDEESKQSINPAGDDNQNEDITKFLEMELAELEQEEELEKQLSMVKNMEDLTSEDFPLFLTVKKLLYMLDATTDYPFFCRDSNGNQISMEGTAGWHNERNSSGGQSGGVFMINNYHKQDSNLDEQIKLFGMKLLDLDAQIQSATLPDESSNPSNPQPKQPEIDQFLNDLDLPGLTSTGGKQSLSQMGVINQQLSYEIDFETFKSKFWPKVAPWTKVSVLVAWTEIFSKIKGHQDSWKNTIGGLSIQEYKASEQGQFKQKTKPNRRQEMDSFLKKVELAQIYRIFLEYEKWKKEQGAYDLMDLVNHILRQVNANQLKPCMQMHFMMVDEVQDLTQNTISLLMKMAQKNIFFSGDTAQTIAKGLGFRFYDLKKVFDDATKGINEEELNKNTNLQQPKVLYLAKNFRSHARILDLANSVVSLIELLFPKTIDKLMKETSDLHGPKPLIIDPLSTKNLQKLFKNYLLYPNAQDSGKLQNQSKDQKSETKAGQAFGCSKVVLVRDQASKDRVPDFLKELLCLTVYEAKGLEFDDVILFNFFMDSKCDSQWKLLGDVEAQTQLVKIHADKFFDLDTLKGETNDEDEDIEVLSDDDSDSFQNVQKDDDAQQINTMTNDQRKNQKEDDQVEQKSINKITEDGKEYQTILNLKKSRHEIYRKFAQVCTELKLLYVAITRPKTNLIIYDEDKTSRKPIQAYWQTLGSVEVLDKTMLSDPDFNGPDTDQSHQNQNLLLPESVKKLFCLGPKYGLDSSILSNLDSPEQRESKKLNWRYQGLKLFKVKYYNAAIQCFQHSQDDDLVTRCRAYESADAGAVLRGEHSAQLALAKDKKNGLSKTERNQLKKDCKDKLKECKRLMNEAGLLFAKINLDKQAAMCFYSSGDVHNSADIFVKQKKYGQAAQCYFQMGKMHEAADLYAKGKLFANAFECYERVEAWDDLMNCLHKYKNEFCESDRQVLIDKYFPIALNSVYQMYEMMGDNNQKMNEIIGGEKNAGRVKQMQIKLKYQKSSGGIIQEEDPDDEEDDDDDSEEDQQNVNQQKEVVQEDDKEQKVQDQEEIKQVEEEVKENSEEQDLDQAIDLKNPEINLDNVDRGMELDLLSNIDPQDEFLRSGQSINLVEQLSCNESSYEILSSQTSEFSIVQGSKMHSFIQSCASFTDVLENSDAQKQNQDSIASIVQNQKQEPNNNSAVSSLLNSSNYSVINFQKDTFVEDMIVQKLIHYVSLFSSEIHTELQQLRSKDALTQIIQKDQASQDAGEDDDLAYMLIDLDELTPALLKNVLNTLEHYGLYSMCIMLCDRYKILNVNRGRYVSAIAQRYSNLNQFQYSWRDKFMFPEQVAAQKRYTLVANEAMHNVLSMVGAGLTDISDQDNDQVDPWREQCFEVLFKLGFWKKLVFLMKPEAGMQLAWACGDNVSLKLIYITCICGITNPEQVNKLLFQDSEFIKFQQNRGQENWDKKFIDLINSVKKEEEALNYFKVPEYHEDHNRLRKNPFNKIKEDAFSIKEKMMIAILIANCKRAKYPRKYNTMTIAQPIKNLPLSRQVQMFSRLIDALTKDFETEARYVYMCFRCYLLDGLDLFDKFDGNYMLMSDVSQIKDQAFWLKEDKLIKVDQMRQHQEYQIGIYRLELLFSKLQGLLDKKADEKEQMSKQKKKQKVSDLTETEILDYLQEYHGKYSISCEAEKMPIDQELAQVVDLELQRILVPKRWVFNMVNHRIVEYCLQLCGINPIEQKIWLPVLQKLEKLLITQGDMSCLKEFQMKLSVLKKHNIIKHFGLDFVNIAYKVAFGTHSPFSFKHLFFERFQEASQGFYQLPSIQKRIKIANNYQYDKLGNQLAPSLQLAVKPQFTIFKSPEVSRDALNVCLKQGFYLLQQAIENPMKDQFSSLLFRAAEQFFKVDHYPLLSEVMQAKIKNQQSPQVKARLKFVYELLDAHVYLKCNDWGTAVDSLSKFLLNTYETIDLMHFSSIIQECLVRSIFSHSMYQKSFSQTEGTMININQIWYLNLSPEETKMLQEKENDQERIVVLQDLRLKVGTFKQVEKVMKWVLCLVQTAEANISLLERNQTHQLGFDIGAQAIEQVLVSNASDQEIFKLKETLSEIAQIVFKYVSKDKRFKQIRQGSDSEDNDYYEENNSKSVFAGQMLLLREAQSEAQFKKVRETILKNLNYKYVIYKLKDFKAVASRVNQINLDVNSALDMALAVENESLELRQKAASKIHQVWTTKRQSVMHVKFETPSLPKPTLGFVIPSHQLKIRLNVPKVTENFCKSLKLQRRLLAILASGAPLCHGSLDLQHTLTALTKVSEAHQSLNSKLNPHPRINDQWQKSWEPIMWQEANQLALVVKQESQNLDDWLNQIQSDSKSKKLQMTKADLMQKREKWDSVMQLHKKKKVMLKHLAQTQKHL